MSKFHAVGKSSMVFAQSSDTTLEVTVGADKVALSFLIANILASVYHEGSNVQHSFEINETEFRSVHHLNGEVIESKVTLPFKVGQLADQPYVQIGVSEPEYLTIGQVEFTIINPIYSNYVIQCNLVNDEFEQFRCDELTWRIFSNYLPDEYEGVSDTEMFIISETGLIIILEKNSVGSWQLSTNPVWEDINDLTESKIPNVCSNVLSIFA